MFIQQVEIENFKSFADKTVIPFKTGFTTISGPNGSGKSNIIDSILFCLGLSSSRTMRAEKLTDLINNLSKKREANVVITFNTAQPHQARNKGSHAETEVGQSLEPTSVLDAVLGESPSSEVGLLQNKDEAEQGPQLITVGRRIKDGPNGYTSTYYLNGKVSTLTDIHDYLSRFNISPGCYNVMMQGDVAGIVNMSAMERRKIIDEIAGVAEFDRKIEKAQEELETTKTNIERNQILLSEIFTRMEQLEQERTHALKYQKLRDEKQSFESKLLAARYCQIKQGIQLAAQNMIQAKKDKESAQAQVAQLQQQVLVTRNALTRLSEEVKRKGEDQQIAIKKQIEGLKGHIARKQDSIQFVTQQREDGMKAIERMESEILRQKGNIETIDVEIEGLQHQLKELQGHYEKEAKAYDALNAQFDQMTESTGELANQRAEVREALGMAEDELGRLNRDMLDAQAEQKRLQEDFLRRQSLANESQSRRDELLGRQSSLKLSLTAAEDEKMILEGRLKKTQLEYSQTRVAIQNAQAKYNELNRDYLRLDAQKRAYDEVNFGRAVETILRSGLEGVHGTLAQLCDIESEFAVALETAMGGRLQNIVVDHDGVAQQAIEMLKQQKAGRATLLPLNKIHRARSLPVAPRDAGVVDYAFNLLEFDGQYEDVFYYALGETLVVEDMASARKLLNKHRMVTLDGSLLEKSGAMSGGATANTGRGGSRLGSTKKLDEELEQILKRLDRAEADKAKLEKDLNTLELTMDSLKTQYAEAMQTLNKLQMEWDALVDELKRLGVSAENGLGSEAGLSTELEGIQTRLTTLTQQMIQLEKAQEAQELVVIQHRQKLDKVEEQLPADQLDGLRKQIQDVKFQRDYYDSQLRNVQADIKGKELEKNHQELGIQHFSDKILETKGSFSEIEKQKKEAEEEIRLTQVQIQSLEAQTQVLDEELKKLQQERDAVQAQLIEEEKNKHYLERQLSTYDEQILSYQARKRELEPQLAEAKQVLLDSGVDLEAIQPEELPSEEEVTKQISSLTRRMEAMEPVNMLAIKEYDEVHSRQGELKEKVDTLTRETETLNVKISGYEDLKRLSFMKAFSNVDLNFKTIFGELSDGEGALVLTNPDDPFAGGMTIQAQPRGKKMQRMEAMSGGEKSLTSLAFVFALQRYMPAPFYALDEVDMNLDGINAEKLANMVKRESNSAQFIVVSLRKPMIEHSDRTVGVTQRRGGASKVTGVKLRLDEDLLPDELKENEVDADGSAA